MEKKKSQKVFCALFVRQELMLTFFGYFLYFKSGMWRFPGRFPNYSNGLRMFCFLYLLCQHTLELVIKILGLVQIVNSRKQSSLPQINNLFFCARTTENRVWHLSQWLSGFGGLSGRHWLLVQILFSVGLGFIRLGV